MIVADDFVFLHVPKTGGTFVTEMLTKLDARIDGFSARALPDRKHAGIGKIPSEDGGKPVVVTVRNVFDHYVSRYHFRWWADPAWASERFHLDLVQRDFPRFPDLSFQEFLTFINSWHYRRKMTHKGMDSLLNELQIGLNTWELTRVCHRGHRRFLKAFDNMSDASVKAEFGKLHFLRTERLNGDLYDFLIQQGYKPQDLQFILDAPPVLPKADTSHDSRRRNDYFNDDLVNFVMRRDRLFFRLFPDMSPTVSLGGKP